jgi:hypothetical protein
MRVTKDSGDFSFASAARAFATPRIARHAGVMTSVSKTTAHEFSGRELN